jgi:dsRNA-specific ribonuclease
VRNVEINPQMPAAAKDPKTELQEWLQGRKMKLPVYRVAATLGVAHKQTFEVECEVPELGMPPSAALAAHAGRASRPRPPPCSSP